MESDAPPPAPVGRVEGPAVKDVVHELLAQRDGADKHHDGDELGSEREDTAPLRKVRLCVGVWWGEGRRGGALERACGGGRRWRDSHTVNDIANLHMLMRVADGEPGRRDDNIAQVKQASEMRYGMHSQP